MSDTNGNRLDQLTENMLNLQAGMASMQAATASLQAATALMQNNMVAMQAEIREVDKRNEARFQQVLMVLQALPEAVREKIGFAPHK